MSNSAGSNGTDRPAVHPGTCQICAASLPHGAMFCGECGSSTSATPLTRRRADPRAHDTTIIAPLPRSSVISVPVLLPPAPPRRAAPPAAAPDPAPAAQATPAAQAAEAAPSSFAPPRPSETPSADPSDEADPALFERARFILHFSTGESVTVHGPGLVGRRPLPQPGEDFDHLVQIQDAGMSVSKTHLEFGQHDGDFWVNDRFSGNGTVIHRPADSSLRCESGRRYLVARGSRVDIADQFFLLT